MRPRCSAGGPTCSATTRPARPTTAGARACSCSSRRAPSARCAGRSTAGCRPPSRAGRCATGGTTWRRATGSRSPRSTAGWAIAWGSCRGRPARSRWLGTAFAGLDAAGEVGPALAAALAAGDHAGREQGLATAYEAVARRFNALGLTEPVSPATRPYHSRPFRVLHADRFVRACTERITDPWLRRLPLVGAVDQAVDTTDLLSHAGRARRYRALLADLA